MSGGGAVGVLLPLGEATVGAAGGCAAGCLPLAALPPAVPALTKNRAIALQQELLASFTAPRFQGKLDELERKHGEQTEEFAEGRRKLIREVQAEILPKFNFEATDEGARQMVLAFDQLVAGVPEVDKLAAQIEKALRCDSRGQLSLSSTIDLLQSQIAILGSEEFQKQIQHLPRKGKLDSQEEFRLFVSRMEIALQYQWSSLGKYGFEASHRGAYAMMAEVSKYLDVPEVAQLLDEMLKKVGLKPSARVVVKARLSTCCPALTHCAAHDAIEAGGAERKSSKPRVESAVLAAADASRQQPLLTKARAIEFLHCLHISYTEPSFLRRAMELKAAHGESFKPVLARLVRSVQVDILPNFGVAATDAGVQEFNDVVHTLCATDSEVLALYNVVQAALLEVAGVQSDAASRSSPAAPTAVGALAAARGTAPQGSDSAAPPVLPARRAAAAAAAPPAACAEQVAPIAVALSATSTPASSPVAPGAAGDAPKLTRGRAEAILNDLESSVALRAVLRQPSDSAKAADATRQVLREVLPRYRFEDNEDGLRLVWKAAEPHFTDLAVAQKAKDLIDRLLGMLRDPASDKAGAAPSWTITIEQAAEFHATLLKELSAPVFQGRLEELYRTHSTASPEFGRAFAALTDPVLDDVCSRHGLPAASQDLPMAMMAFARFYDEQSSQGVVSAVDEALFGKERSAAGAGSRLGEVVGVLRSQLAAFSRPAFQRSIEALKSAAPASKADGYFRLPGRREASMDAQAEALRQHGLDDTARGAHAMLVRTSQFVCVNQVAALLDAINSKLGMEPSAQRKFRERISVVDLVDVGAGPQAAAAGA